MLFVTTHCFDNYVLEIPNGLNTPDPCNTTDKWLGVGHFLKEGSGVSNQFGEDFKSNDFKWTLELCRLDSDQDSRTNGEELGDPDCKWRPEGTPDITARDALSHPGVCEPIDAPLCKRLNFFLNC